MILFVVGMLLLIIFLVMWGERGFIIRKSTFKVIRHEKTINFFNFNALHEYIYGRWPKFYVRFVVRYLGTRFGPRYRKRLANTYHSKVLTYEDAKSIITLEKEIPLQDLEQIIPYPTARKILLENPLNIVVAECPCRASSPNPCKPSQVCMVIGNPFADFVLEHRPLESKRLTQKEALKLLAEVHEKGCIHTAWFKEACMERFYVICNCCKCCCAGIEAMIKNGIPMLAPSGYVAEIKPVKCVKCGLCVKKCPFNAISLKETPHVNFEKCMGCGVCVTMCSKGAVKLRRDEAKGTPLDVNNL